MSAPAPNIMAAGPSGAAPGAKTGPTVGGGLAGFEALLAALFPQGAPGGAAAAPGIAVATAATGAGGKGANAAVAEAKAAAGQTSKSSGDDPKAKDKAAAPDDAGQADAGETDAAAAALTASLAAAPAASATASATSQAATAAAPGAASDATARGKPLAVPPEVATPADRMADADVAQGDAGPVGPGAKPTTDGADTPKSAADPAPPAWGRDKPAGQPAAPALQHAQVEPGPGKPPPPQATTTPPQPAGGAEAAPPDPTALATAESASPLAALAQPPAAGERPQKAAPERAAKAETAAKSNETALPPGMRPVEAADRPVHARAAEAAGAQPAAKDAIETASSDDIQGKDAGAAPTPDDHGPDPAPAAEGRGAAPPAAALAHASAPVRGSPETVAALAAQIVKKLDGRATRFDLELDPAGLGKVDVRLEIGAQGRITAALTCDNPHAANELRARANELQRALEQAGFDLSGGLSFDVADNGRQQGQPWQDQSQDGAGGFRGQAFRAALETAGEADAGASGPLRLRHGITAGLDLRI